MSGKNDRGTDNNPKADLDNINAYSWLKGFLIYWSYHPEIKNMDVSRADNSVKIWWNLAISNSKPDFLTVNTYSKFG